VATLVVGALRDLARNGRTVVCTIHQPRSSIFAMFDQLMLLTDGRLVYIGDAHGAVGYFETLHFRCPDLTNPADFFMDVTSVDYRGEEREGNSRGRVAAFAAQAERRGLGAAAAAAALKTLELEDADKDKDTNKDKDKDNNGGYGNGDVATNDGANVNGVANPGIPGGSSHTPPVPPAGGAGWLHQFALLLRRAFICQKRDVVVGAVQVELSVTHSLKAPVSILACIK
jgi:hypothetical protein